MEWFGKLIDSIENGNYTVTFIIIFIVLLVNAKNILGLLDEFHSKKIKRVNQYLESEYLDSDAKNILIEKLNYLMFKSATGIPADKFFRQKLIEIYEKGKGKIP